MNTTKIIVITETSSSKFKEGDKGFISGYYYDAQYLSPKVVIVLDKDGSFHSLPFSFIKHQK